MLNALAAQRKCGNHRFKCPEALTGKANQTINLIFQKILFAGKPLLFKMNLSKEQLK
ncbi:hypothetical protein AQPE_3479 [Aquipluma nitroreducens]|uniref:Uncharacterized protein n=1 Tax=Aquipluma nitroreducens TaxID=2010828 RepID=A0A5K7SCV2_9BACT|nr:hypothetical protein AQPE_3479 [Aquipluma nitroreducens]